jgi:hypothetical protein
MSTTTRTSGKRTLFIGGIADGERLTVPDSAEIWRVAKSGKRIDEISREVIYNIYHQMLVGAGTGAPQRIFIYDQMTQHDAMMKFIECYNPRTNAEMNDTDWHQVQTVTKTDIMSMVMDYIQGRSTSQGLMQAISDHCQAAYDVGRNKHGQPTVERLDEA